MHVCPMELTTIAAPMKGMERRWLDVLSLLPRQQGEKERNSLSKEERGGDENARATEGQELSLRRGIGKWKIWSDLFL